MRNNSIYVYILFVCVILDVIYSVLDANLERLATKVIESEQLPEFRRPVHLNICLTRDTDLRQLVMVIHII